MKAGHLKSKTRLLIAAYLIPTYILTCIIGNPFFITSNSLAYADATTTSTTTASTIASTSLDEMDTICPQNSASPTPTSTGNLTGSNKDTYCAAARTSLKGAEQNELLFKIWVSVASVCGVICASSFKVGTVDMASYGCIGTNVAATLAEAKISGQYATAIQGLVGNLMMMGMMKQMGGKSAAASAGTEAATGEKAAKPGTTAAGDTAVTTTEEGASTGTTAATEASGAKDAGAKAATNAGKAGNNNKDMSSCMTMVTAGLQSYAKKSGADSDHKAALDNLKSAKQAQSDLAAGIAQTTVATAVDTSQNGQVGHELGKLVGLSSGSSSPTSAFGGAMGMIAAATAADSSLPPGISDPKFPANFQKTTGLNLDNFLNNANDPKQAISAAMAGAGLDSGQMAKVDSTLNQLKDIASSAGTDVPTPSSESHYSSGGSAPPASASEEDPMAAMMAQMMGQLMPGAGGAGNDNSRIAQELDFTKRIKAGNIEQDKTVSIFDRISHRYAIFEVNGFRKGI